MLRRGGTLVVLILGLWAGVPAAPACADGGLTGSNPPAGAALDAAPAEVALTFSDAPSVDYSHVSVLDDRGTIVNDGDVRGGRAATLHQPIAVDGPGNFTIAWHVILTDGGESTGSLRFSVGTGIGPPPADAELRRAATEAVAGHQHEIDSVSALVLVLDGVVVLAVLGLLYLRRPYPAAPGDPDQDDRADDLPQPV